MSSLSSKDGPRYRHVVDELTPYETIGVDKLTPIIGAEIDGVDLAKSLSNRTVDAMTTRGQAVASWVRENAERWCYQRRRLQCPMTSALDIAWFPLPRIARPSSSHYARRTIIGARCLIDGAPTCCITARVSTRRISSTR